MKISQACKFCLRGDAPAGIMQLTRLRAEISEYSGFYENENALGLRQGFKR